LDLYSHHGPREGAVIIPLPGVEEFWGEGRVEGVSQQYKLELYLSNKDHMISKTSICRGE
jgi:hypothetical protein